MNKKWLVPVVILVVVVLLAGVFATGYNGLVKTRETVQVKFGDLQTQYQRRADLIPNLVATVKAGATFEQNILDEVVEARSKATSVTVDPSNASAAQIAQYQSAQSGLSQSLGRLLMVTEDYPELKSIQGFIDLQIQLEGTENRITVARKDLNAEAGTYNTKMKTFPTNLLAKMFNFEEYPYFDAYEGAEIAPVVNFE